MSLARAREHFEAHDPALHAATADLKPIVLKRPRDPYVALLRAIVGQQLSTKASASIWGRITERYGAAPEASVIAAADDETLRGLGLSYRKASYFRGVAEAKRRGDLELADLKKLGDDALVARLTAIRGVGAWSVQMIMIFGMKRRDVFAAGDLGLQHAMRATHGVEGKGKALERKLSSMAEAWSPHRSLACRLLWAYYEEHLR